MDSKNSRMAKNTGLLYFRMIFLTLINLYAVRVALEALGEVDYGIYNVLGSVVMSLSVLTGAMTSASQRFLSYHLGKDDKDSYSRTFTLLLMIFIAFSAVLLIVGEALGHLFVEKWLDIPADRIPAAGWVYQASLVAFIFSFITIPYTSSIVANERMDAFAAFSIVEGGLRLGIALWLMVYGGDKLEFYGIMMGGISVVVFLMSMQYCHVKFRYCRYIWKWDKSIFRQLASYTGWNLFGSVSGILSNQGQTVLLNIYFGPVINAAKAIADRILHTIQGFCVNIYMAISPQIIKSYAAEDYKRAHNLVFVTSKLSFMLIYMMSFPLICAMRGILDIWLAKGQVTEPMIAFSVLNLIYCLVYTLEQPISRLIQATGKIKRYQVAVGIITLMYIPVAILVLAFGGSPAMTTIVQIVILSVAQIVRVIVAHRQVQLDYGRYLKEVVWPIVKVLLISLPVYWAMCLGDTHHKVWEIFGNIVLTGFMGMFVVAFFGITPAERSMVWNWILKRIHRNTQE